jgi:predicted ATPase
VLRRELARARELAEAAIEIAREQEFAFVLGGGRLIRAFTLFDPQTGGLTLEEADREFQLAVSELSTTGTEITRPSILGHLSDAYRSAGRSKEASAAVEAALAISQNTSQPYWDAELHRLRGELLLQEKGAPHGKAEQLFTRALTLAREQKAKSLELRAAMSLSRLWQTQGRAEEVRALLAPVYDSFSEGFDTLDLLEARALLERAV